MPVKRGQKFNKEAQRSSAFGKAISAGLTDSNRKLMNAIEFIEGPTGLGITLRPVQRVVAKCVFGVPLDFRPSWADNIPNWGKVEMWDPFREKLLRTVSEEEYLQIAYEEGRCNVRDWRDIPNVGKTYGGYNEVVIFAGRRSGKEIHVDTLIPTPSGFVRNGDLKDGDEVLGEDGKPHKVLYAHPIHEEESYKVSFDDGTFVYANASHRWLTYMRKERKNVKRRQPREVVIVPGYCGCGCGKRTPIATMNIPSQKIVKGEPRLFCRGHSYRDPIKGKVRTTKEILDTLQVKTSSTGSGLQSNHAVCLPNPIELPEKCLPIDPYFLGVWLGDGSKSHAAITTNDKEIVDVCYSTAASYGLRVYIDTKKTTKASTYHITTGKSFPGCGGKGRNALRTALQQLNLIKNKHIPHDYLWASKEQRLALLQGLMDTNGYCDVGGNVEFCNTNEKLAKGVYHLAASLGIKPHWKEGRAKLYGKDCGPKYRITWTSMLPVFRLPRKLVRLPKKVKDTQNWRYIVSVEPVGKMPMRCITTDNPTGLYLFGENFNVTHNSELTAAITAYKLYLLLNLKSPQELFGLVPGSPIDITYLAQDDKGADRLFKKLREDVNRCSFFEPFLKDNNSKNLTFVSESDRHKRDITPTLTVWSLPCTTNAVRGPSSVFLALDEFAHFRSAKGSNSEDMYEAATPSTGDFHHVQRVYDDGTNEYLSAKREEEMDEEDLPEDYYQEIENTTDISDSVYTKNTTSTNYQDIDIQDSMIFSISSPLKRVGKMYELHKMALEEGVESSIFTLSCSSAEMNNKLLPKFLKTEYKKNPLSFRAEYGGQFLESSESYVTEVAVKSCVDCQWDEKGLPIEGTIRRNAVHFNPTTQVGINYFWGFDLGMVNDASALAIAHLEFGGEHGGIKLVYDYIDRMMVGERFEGPGISMLPGEQKYDGFQVLPLGDILLWLRAMNRMMPCFRGATDQHGGQQLVQLLDVNEIKNMELLNLTPAINSQMAYALRGYIENNLCSFPYVPKFIRELKMVELEVAAKYQIRVQASLEKGAHDDMVDAAQICAFLAQKWLVEEGHLHMDPTGLSLLMQVQQNKPSGALLSLDGVSMQSLKSMEKMKKIGNGMTGFSGGCPVSPFSRRRR